VAALPYPIEEVVAALAGHAFTVKMLPVDDVRVLLDDDDNRRDVIDSIVEVAKRAGTIPACFEPNEECERLILSCFLDRYTRLYAHAFS